jgi:hypothetical protein
MVKQRRTVIPIETENVIPEIRDNELKPTLQDYYEQLMKTSTGKCEWCGHPFLLRNMQHFDHSDGWPLEGSALLQWVFVHCTYCRYDWAIWKLGVERYKK